MTKSILMICGYKGSGKDTFYQQLLLEIHDEPMTYQYIPLISPDLVEPKKEVFSNIVRVAFADILKQEVLDIYQIPKEYSSDELKDKPIPNFQVSEELEHKMKNMNEMKLEPPFTFRDFCLYQAKIRRDEDPCYWVKQAYPKICESPENTLCVITDFRYPNEYEYLKSFPENNILTIRIFRSEVPIPGVELKSEHALDDFSTDIIVMSCSEDTYARETVALLKTFPQYSKHIANVLMN